MTKYSSFKQQQLITESWRTFIVEQQPQAQQQPQALTAQNLKQSIVDLARQPVKEKGPNNDTRKLFSNSQIIAKLQQLVQSNDIIGAFNLFKQNATGDDFTEMLQIQQEIEKAAAKAAPAAAAPAAVSSVKEVVRGTSSRPIASAIKSATSLANRGLFNLGDGDVTKGLNRFTGYSAFTVLSGMILGNLMNLVATRDPSSLKDALELIPHLKNSLSLSNSGQLSKFITDTTDTGIGKRDDSIYEGAHLDDGTLVCEACLEELLESQTTVIQEAKYQGRTVTLNKPTAGDVKKFKVYVKDPSTGNIKKVNFGDPNMKIKKNIPARRKSFRARHNCANPGPKTKARYWSCKKW
jgi:hypothetical protein